MPSHATCHPMLAVTLAEFELAHSLYFFCEALF